ncbi:MAG: hypothetical protein ACRCXT_08780, partial [Paraclostridium sp.]
MNGSYSDIIKKLKNVPYGLDSIIDEIKTSIDNINPNVTSVDVSIVDTNNVFTSENVEGALQELHTKYTEVFQSVSNGKTSIAQAITDKGVNASANDSFTELANKIASIESGLEVPMSVPTWTVNIGNITAVCDTVNGLFREFRVDGGAWQTSTTFTGLTGNTSYLFEGKYGRDSVGSIRVTTPKANQAKPAKPTASNITDTTITVTAP